MVPQLIVAFVGPNPAFLCMIVMAEVKLPLSEFSIIQTKSLYEKQSVNIIKSIATIFVALKKILLKSKKCEKALRFAFLNRKQ